MFCGSQSGDVLHVDLASKVRPTDVALGQNKRSINCKLLAWLGSQGCRGTVLGLL